ncbi:MAG: hypothetical protein JST40_10745 [Armatimonadetes bacterium]|nr:hypothetical protein [Armatimonadota bacterium]
MSLLLSVVLSATLVSAEPGLRIGENVPAFEPHHFSGPDKGTDTCPVCKYVDRPAVQIWVSGGWDPDLVPALRVLNSDVQRYRKAEFKAFANFVVPKGQIDPTGQVLEQMGSVEDLPGVALMATPTDDTVLPAVKFPTDGSVKNIVFVYKNRKVVAKFVNIGGDRTSMRELHQSIDRIARK